MNTQQLEKPLWSDGYRFMAALTGSTQAKVMLQVFDDRGEDGRLAEWRYGRLTDQAIQKWLVVKIKAGCGVFVTMNRTDGTGRRRQNVTHYQASFIDLDGKELPTRWPIQPDIIIESSAGRYRVLAARARDETWPCGRIRRRGWRPIMAATKKSLTRRAS